MSQAPAAEKAPAKSRNTGLILQIAFAVINLLTMGAGSYMVYASTIGWESPKITEEMAAEELASEAKEEVSEPLTYTMEKFTVNLGGVPQKTIRLEVNLEMLGKEGFEEVMDPENRAKARDRIVRILNEKEFSELETIQGKLFLKDRIAGDVNEILSRGVVKDVYFSEFIVQ